MDDWRPTEDNNGSGSLTNGFDVSDGNTSSGGNALRESNTGSMSEGAGANDGYHGNNGGSYGYNGGGYGNYGNNGYAGGPNGSYYPRSAGGNGRPYGGPAYNGSMYPDQAPKKTGFAVAALVLGISGLLFFWIPFIGVIVALAGIVLGIIALNKKQSSGLSIGGIVCGAIALLLSIIVTIFIVLVVAVVSEDIEKNGGKYFSQYGRNYEQFDDIDRFNGFFNDFDF